MKQSKADALLRLNGGVQAHGDVHEPERQCPSPQRAHGGSICQEDMCNRISVALGHAFCNCGAINSASTCACGNSQVVDIQPLKRTVEIGYVRGRSGAKNHVENAVDSRVDWV